MELPRPLLEEHLAGVVVLFQDPEGLVGLRPPDRGEAVRRLQQRLKQVGLYELDPTGVYDPFTEAVVEKYREKKMIPGGAEIDPLLALYLIRETEKPEAPEQ